MARFFADEVAAPLELDLWLDLPESQESRVAPIALMEDWSASPNEARPAQAMGGEIDGVRLLSERTVRLGRNELARGVELFMGTPIAYGVGFALQTEQMTFGPAPDAVRPRRRGRVDPRRLALGSGRLLLQHEPAAWE